MVVVVVSEGMLVENRIAIFLIFGYKLHSAFLLNLFAKNHPTLVRESFGTANWSFKYLPRQFILLYELTIQSHRPKMLAYGEQKRPE